MEWIRGESSAELRDRYLKRHLEPLAHQAFTTDPEVRCIILAVAQFYQGGAEHAVHIELVPCADDVPEWPTCLADERFFTSHEEGDEAYVYPSERTDQLVINNQLPDLNKNGEAIVAFGAYCKPGCHQDMTVAEAFLPYAVARPSEDGSSVNVEIVGRVYQPYWENRFEILNPPAPPEPEVTESRLQKWVRQLFGSGG